MANIPRKYPGETAIICGTGPTITAEIIGAVNDSGLRACGCSAPIAPMRFLTAM